MLQQLATKWTESFVVNQTNLPCEAGIPGFTTELVFLICKIEITTPHLHTCLEDKSK